jgi:plastocyanin
MTFVHGSRRLVLVGGLLLVALGLAAPVLAATVAVNIADKAFDPSGVVIHTGDTVTWTVTKSINEGHTVTSGLPTDAKPGAIFDSGIDKIAKLKDNGGTYSFTFDAAGTYAYFCQVHPSMTGTITVLAAGENPGEAEAGIPIERRAIGAGILIVTLIVLFGAAMVWRRMNSA